MYVEGVRLPWWVALPLALIGAVLLMVLVLPHRLLQWGLPSAAIVAAAVLWMPRRPYRWLAPLSFAGDASYALYLTHLPILRLVATALRDGGRFDLGQHPIVYAAVAIAAALGVAAAVHLWIERPLIVWARRGMARLRARASVQMP
jgi:peptidoglycan/LPS O-acetylase OafA/YrhL